ncbi:hypothetical protein [Cloacibacillus sp. An23]|uniref:hypothetical protein n=1 Tax=Cloacibacillus sp. An23 TaxID=1965591 RepID=UPI00117793C6|nr:hypothetical protein [Cloacibacillus sp. An23]
MLLIIASSTALASATLTESGEIAAPKSDIREVVADNAALVAEVEAIRQALSEERKSTQELINELNAYTTASAEERTLLREQNEILKAMSDAYKRKAEAERQKGWGKLILGLVIGGAVGAIAN